MADWTTYIVKEYLARHPDILEEFLLHNVSTDYIQEILKKIRSRQKLPNTGSLLKQQQSVEEITDLYSATGTENFCKRISACISDNEICQAINEMCRVVGYCINAEGFSLYLVEGNGMDISLYKPGKNFQHLGPVGRNMTVSAHVAKEKVSVNVTDLQQDSRFPKGICLGDDKTHQVIAIPILLEKGRCYVVAEFTRGWNYDPFSNTEFEITNAIFSWISACVQKMKINKMLKIQRTLNGFLLEATKVMFDDLYNIDSIVDNIMIFTKELVSADRCALFLVDEERNELYADLFDEGKVSETGSPMFTKKSQIRFRKDRGIAGYVAATCKTVNIKDAYKDVRFNPEIDKKTGYHTKNILCMPISGKHGVIGVVQMINRLEGEHFTRDDEEAFETFAVYCALALHYSKLYSALSRQQSMYKITTEVLDFHVPESKQNAKALAADYRLPDDKIPADFCTYDFCAYDYTSILPKLFIRIVQDLFGKSTFEIETLCRFTMAIRKNYRHVAYHNWEHGFHVAHCVWRMTKTCNGIELTDYEKMALIFGAISHDIDHRGYNNDFYRKMRLPLAALYSDSVLENHHYQQMVAILHAEGHDIFSFLPADEYTAMLDRLRKVILATDLALYFGNQKFLASLIDKGEFRMDVPEHRSSLISLMMTGADLCATSKPWTTQAKTIQYLYEEFWMQGDEEKKENFEPLAMMDRNKKFEIPNQQIGFINFICKPLYGTLVSLLPETRPLLTGCEVTEENWRRILREREERNKNTSEITVN